MARNEAKIKFTAETRELTAQLKNANSALASLRAGLKLNDAELKNNGNQTEYLKNKQKLLQAELEANRSKQEALNGKLEAAKAIYGEDSAEVQNWSRKLTQAKTEQQQLEAALGQTEQALQEQTAAEERAQSPLEQLNRKIEEQHRELEQLKTEYKNVALEQGTDSQAAQELKSKIDQLNTELDEEESKLREVDSALDEAGSSAESSATGGWSVLNQIIADLARNAIQQAINKIQEFARETVQLGIDFSSSMSNVQALSGATDDELSQLEQTARDLGSSTIFSASDVSDAFGYMALAGWDVQDMLGGIDGVLNLAAAANMDLAEASDIVTDYLTAFGLSADDAGAFVDQLAFAMANSNTDVTQLGEAYKNCAATANSMGFSVEDTTAALMTMANAGVKGGEAGTGLSSIMTRLATDTKGCAGELEKYGVQVYDAQGNMNDLSSILNGCASIWGDLTDAEQASLAKTIAGTSQYSKFQTVMSGLSEQAEESGSSFNDYTQALEDVKTASDNGESAAQNMADTMQDNLGGDIKELNSAMEEFKLKIYDGIENPMRDIVQFVTGSVIPAATQVLQFIQKHSTAFGILAGVLGVITTAMLLHSAAQAIQTAMNAAEVTSLGALIAAKMASAAASWAALAPYILIVAAIVAVIAIIVLCVKHWDQIKTKMIEVVNIIKSHVITAWNAVKNTISTVMNSIKSVITTIWNAIKNTVTSVVNGVRNTVSSVFNAIRSVASSVWNAIKTAITNPIQTARSTVSSVLSAIRSTFSSVVGGIRSTVSSAFNAIKSAMTHPIETAKSTIQGIMNKIKGIFPLRIGRIFSGLSLPHISVSGGKAPFGIGGKGSLPKFSVNWHAKGVVFDAPTLIPTLNGIHGVGEAGPEAVSPVSVLQSYIGAAVQRFVPQIDYDLLGQKVAAAVAKMGITIELNDRELGRVVRGLV